MGTLIYICVFVVLLRDQGEGYYFEDGYEHHYTYESNSHVLSTENLKMIMKFRVRCLNRTSAGGSTNRLFLDSFIQMAGTYEKSNAEHWDLEKRFLFHMSEDGLVDSVHYDPDDKTEAIMMKKLLASTLSAKSKQKLSTPKKFVHTEDDHSGRLEHTYELKRTKEGLHVKKTHESLDKVYRSHSKNMLLSHGGTVQTASMTDLVVLKDRSKPEPKRELLPGEEEIKLTSDEPVPEITTKCDSNIKLEKKRQMGNDIHQQYDISGLVMDSIVITKVARDKPKQLSREKYRENVEKHIRCIDSYENKTSSGRTDCVIELRRTLHEMTEAQYKRIAEAELNQSCGIHAASCHSRKDLFIDLVSNKGDNFSQSLLVSLFLRNPIANISDLERILANVVGLDHPTMELILAVEDLCFGKNGEIHGRKQLSHLQKRSCLSLGGLVKLGRPYYPHKMEDIVEKFEVWLKAHNKTEANAIIQPRKKRSVEEYDLRRHHYIEYKLVLIHALGNTGMERSRDMIISYMSPDYGHNGWKHAAIHGLRFYTCNESAEALVHSFIGDQDELVRELAHRMYKNHPLCGDGHNHQHKNIVRSKFYTYRHLVRLKRSLVTARFDKDGIYFSIKLPGVDWKKTVGGSAVGASFGLTIRNGMEVSVKPLSGYGEVDVYNEGYATVHIGWFGLKYDLVRAFACYQGHIRYDLNILKDFGIEQIGDLAAVFDKIYRSIVDPIEKGVAAFKAVINLFKGGLKNIVNTIVEFIKNLPIILKNLMNKLVDEVWRVLNYKAYPWIYQIQKILMKIKYFIEDIKADILEFYNTIADAVTVTLPYGAKKVYDAIAGINNSFRNFFKNPVQSLFGVGRAVLDIRFAIGIFLDVKSKVVEAITMATGKSPFWMNYDEDLGEIFEDLVDLFDTIANPSSVTSSQQSSSNISSILSDGIKAVTEQTSSVQQILSDAVKDFKNLLTKTLDGLGKPFFDAFRSVMEAVKGIKLSFENLRDMVIKAKSLVEKVFGPKFHVKFPSRRRDESGDCGKGVWPSTTNGKFETIGVDVLAKNRDKIHSPINGIARKRGSSRVIIEPKDADFLDLEIVIDNVDPSMGEGGEYVRAGEDYIGTAISSQCKPNFIHVAIRETSDAAIEDKDYKYVDPSKYLDRLIPHPKWVETCNENYYKSFLSVIDAGILSGAADFLNNAVKRVKEKVEETVKNKIVGAVKDIINSVNKTVMIEINPEPLEHLEKEPEVYRPPGMVLVQNSKPSNVTLWDEFKKGMKSVLGKFKNVAKQLFDFSSNRTGMNILDIVDVNKYTIKQIRDIVDKKHSAAMSILYGKLAALQKSIPANHLDGLSLSKMRQMLKFSIDAITGSKSQMISRILELIEKECPQFAGKLTKGQGHVCFAHPDCQGLTCGVSVMYGAVHEMIEVDLRIDPCTNTINITSPVHSTVLLDISLGEFSHTVRFSNLLVDGLELKLIVEGYTDSNGPIMSVVTDLCTDEYDSCLRTIQLLTDLEIPLSGNCDKAGDKYSIGKLESMNLRELIDVLSEYHLLDKEMLEVTETLREAVLQELLDDPRTILKVLGIEFKNKLDYCKRAAKKFPTLDWGETWDIGPIMVGPIPLYFELGIGAAVGFQLKFAICFSSFTADVTATPWAGAKAWGGAYVQIAIFRGGIRLTGHVLDTRFPIYGGVKYNKFPLNVLGTVDLYLVPLRLVLTAYVRIEFRICFWKCFTVRITLFSGVLWTYTTPPIRRRIITLGKEGKDLTPPTFDDNGRRVSSSASKRSTSTGCELYQIPGRNPSDTAFKLRATVRDDITEANLFFAIGTSQGATDVMGWTDMGGALLVYAVNLPNSIPLYWTLKARNNQGMESFVQCMLHTYDNTVPDGRVDPSYLFSSHPSTLSATIISFDDTPLQNTHLVAVGYSPGRYGNEFIGWKTFSLSDISIRKEITSDLKHFSEPKQGRLTTNPFSIHVKERPSDCATECLRYSKKCVSFDYNYFTEKCELQAFVEGPAAKLRISGHYKNYERLGIGQNAFIEYNNLTLRHGDIYFFNAVINNTLNYTGVMHSIGTMVDFTPPSPGHLGSYYTEEFRADGCNASKDQKNRCINVTPMQNHRIVKDGNESRTVFNGHKPMDDMQYTRSNHFASVNFDGFRDNETGIFRYMWAVGSSVCQADVVDFQDPHEFLHSSKHWTHSGYQKNIMLKDGFYFVAVQALNNIVYGGALVTTVCHTNAFAVDTTPPNFRGVTDIFFDEDFDILGVYYIADDPLSHLYSVDFGLGQTKYDVLVRRYSYHAPMRRKEPYVVIEDLGLPDGIPAWIRIRPVNNVQLFTAGHGNEPVLIDRTAPIPGTVLDGNIVLHDLRYQADDKSICAHWKQFYDAESGIDMFQWGVGLSPGTDDIVLFHNYTHNQRHACVTVSLNHNVIYYSTVIVFNGALNTKNSNSSSNGVLVDVTPPVAGTIHDGGLRGIDQAFSSETATKKCYWDNFTDPESFIHEYQVSISINKKLVKHFDVGLATDFTDHSVAMHHDDDVMFELTATNGAGSTTVVKSDGFKVDHTPPEMTLVLDTSSGLRFQTSDTSLNLRWQYTDDESGIREYRYLVYEDKHGSKSKFWPISDDYATLVPSVHGAVESVDLSNLVLSNGGKYSVKVTAINNAEMSTAHESEGVRVDNTPPLVTLVHIGLLEEDEELNSNGEVEHVDPDGITITWDGIDKESDIIDFYIAIGTQRGDDSVTNGYIAMGIEKTAYVNVPLEIYSDSNKVYYVSVKAKNGAGTFSAVQYSSPIIVLRANVPGVVYDGRLLYEDQTKTTDESSLAISFKGFESESCNIISYEIAVGSEPFFSDLSPFSEFGVSQNGTHGRAERKLSLDEDLSYYATVRAKTGYNCHEDFIVSSSNGIIVDISQPLISDIIPIQDGHSFVAEDIYYQNDLDTLEMQWNVSDSSESVSVNFTVGRLPYLDDIHSTAIALENRLPPGIIKLVAGDSVFVNVFALDDSGHISSKTSTQVTADVSGPHVENFTCSGVLSFDKPQIECHWRSYDMESDIALVSIMVGTKALSSDIIIANLSTSANSWSTYLQDFVRRSNETTVYLTLSLKNIVGRKSVFVTETHIDQTSPEVDVVEFITWSTSSVSPEEKVCQIPWTYVDIRIMGASDKESGVSRSSICLGTKPSLCDVKSFENVSSARRIFIGDLSLEPGDKIYATATVFNGVGLSTVKSSNPITVSPAPVLNVRDGEGEVDRDYQSDLNVVQGHWIYSDPCPVLKAEWAIEDLQGNIIQDFIATPGNGEFMYNDEVSLENNLMYFIKVKITDAINRTTEAMSDGFVVLIQPPGPGAVRDGLTDDIDYQESTTELSVNWDSFGESNSHAPNPTQIIDHYEVAIGNDRQEHDTRVNIHYFINVGLNTSYTFTNLNLTAKTVTYYITVRAYSLTGVFEEEFSNGIRVGFREGVFPGDIEYNPYQSSTDEISVSWNGFEADVGIAKYYVGISKSVVINHNESFSCLELQNYTGFFDIVAPVNVGLNTFNRFTNLSLFHDQIYYMTVFAADIIDICAAATSGPILIDTTPPDVSSVEILINDWNVGSKEYVFVNDDRDIITKIHNVIDTESGIDRSLFTLVRYKSCPNDTNSVNDTEVLAELTRTNATDASFYNIKIQSHVYYGIQVKIQNNAGLVTTMQSPVLSLDKSAAKKGSVKIASDWKTPIDFQSSVSTISAFTAIAKTKTVYDCPNAKIIFPDTKPWTSLGGPYAASSVDQTPDKITMQIGYDIPLTKVLKSGIKSEMINLIEGSYSVNLSSSYGKNIVTTFSMSTKNNYFPTVFVSPKPTIIKENDYHNNVNVTDLNLDPDDNNTNTINTTTTGTTFSTTVTTSSPLVNGSNNTEERMRDSSKIGFGIHILGEKQNNSNGWDILLWAGDKYKYAKEWVILPIDPSTRINTYDIALTKQQSASSVSWNIEFKVNGDSKATLDGLQFPDEMQVYLQTWNKDGYEEPIIDPFQPFRSQTNITEISVPLGNYKPCLDGKGFYDGESELIELWVGVSDNVNNIDNVRSMYLYQSFCIPCEKNCTVGCDKNCTRNNTSTDFEEIAINITNLNLIPTTTNNDGTNSTSETKFTNVSMYYVNAKFVNLAGQESHARSNPVMIDISPPTCELIECTDPVNTGLDEPTTYLGSNTTVGAYWSCLDTLSEIKKYVVTVGTSSVDSSLLEETDVGLKTKVRLDLPTGRAFQHGNTYYVNLKVHNSAGLWNNYSCKTFVSLESPDISNTQRQNLFTDPTRQEVDGASIISQQDRVGVSWDSPIDDAEFYEFQIGTSDGKSDLIPRITVGVSKSGSVAVIDGQLWLNNNNTNRSISEFTTKNWRNMSTDEIHESFQDFSFKSEPGRCLYPKLFAVGYSHLSSEVPTDPVCIARKNDVIENFDTRETYEVTLPASSNSDYVSMNITGDAGGLLAGILSSDDVITSYGSAASSDFLSYIVNPNATMSITDRFLRRRLVKNIGISFFLSPAPDVSLEKITVSIKINPDQYNNDTVPALLIWSTSSTEKNPYGEKGMWKHIEESCAGDPVQPTIENNKYTVEICTSAISSFGSRSKRSTSAHLSAPIQLSLAAMNVTYYNNPPVIDTDAIYLDEDTTVDYTLLWHDDDFDDVIFSLRGQPIHGDANITSDGVVSYIPESDFVGVDMLEIFVSDNTSRIPATISKMIKLVVSNVNDPPISGYVYNNTSYQTLINNTIIITFEANTTHRYILDFYVADIDFNETLTILSSTSNLDNVTFYMTEDTTSDLPSTLFPLQPIRTYRKFEVDMVVDEQFSGDFSYFLLAYDKSGYYTERLEVHVYILKHPCLYGECEPKSNSTHSCDHVSRAATFDPFQCTCDPGYIGEWCQTEVDECAQDPCSVFHYCVDRINNYHCRLNPGKVVAVILSIIFFGFLIYIGFIVAKKKCGEDPRVYVQKFEVDPDYDYGDVDTERLEHIVPGKFGSYLPGVYYNPTYYAKDTCSKPRFDKNSEYLWDNYDADNIPYNDVMRQEFIENRKPIFKREKTRNRDGGLSDDAVKELFDNVDKKHSGMQFKNKNGLNSDGFDEFVMNRMGQQCYTTSYDGDENDCSELSDNDIPLDTMSTGFDDTEWHPADSTSIPKPPPNFSFHAKMLDPIQVQNSLFRQPRENLKENNINEPWNDNINQHSSNISPRRHSPPFSKDLIFTENPLYNPRERPMSPRRTGPPTDAVRNIGSETHLPPLSSLPPGGNLDNNLPLRFISTEGDREYHPPPRPLLAEDDQYYHPPPRPLFAEGDHTYRPPPRPVLSEGDRDLHPPLRPTFNERERTFHPPPRPLQHGESPTMSGIPVGLSNPSTNPFHFPSYDTQDRTRRHDISSKRNVKGYYQGNQGPENHYNDVHPEPDYDCTNQVVVHGRPTSADSDRVASRGSRVITPLGGSTLDVNGSFPDINM